VVSAGGFPGTKFAAAAPCPAPPGTRPPGAITPDRSLSPQLVQWAATSLTCYLKEEVPRLLPTARYARMPGAPAGPLTGYTLGGNNRVDSMTLIRDAAGTGDLTVMVGLVDPSEATREKDSCRGDTAAKCTVQRGPNGETVLLGTERDPLPPDNPRDFVVRVYRGHSEIYVQASNTDRQAADGGAPVATRPEPVLSADQAVQLALSRELYLFP
jgi:hypothetical protein